jgi:hypothetical protein
VALPWARDVPAGRTAPDRHRGSGPADGRRACLRGVLRCVRAALPRPERGFDGSSTACSQIGIWRLGSCRTAMRQTFYTIFRCSNRSTSRSA